MIRVEIKPELFSWARERARLEIVDLSDRFPKLAAWEQGAATPTLKQVEDFAKVTHAPVGFLFLKEPPVEKLPIPDFRTIRNKPIARPSPDPALISVSIHELDGKDVARVVVKASPKPVYDKEAHLYIRPDNSTRPLTPKETVDYCRLHWTS